MNRRRFHTIRAALGVAGLLGSVGMAGTVAVSGTGTASFFPTPAAASSGPEDSEDPAAAGPALESRTPRFSRVLRIPESARPGDWIEVTLDSLAAAGATDDLHDVRIVDASGAVLPYRWRNRTATESLWVPLDTLTIDWQPRAGGGWSARLARRDLEEGTILALAGAEVTLRDPESDRPDLERASRIHGLPPGWTALRLPGGTRVLELASPDPSRPPGTATLRREIRRERHTVEASYRTLGSRFDGSSWVVELELQDPALSLVRLEVEPSTPGAAVQAGIERRDPAGRWTWLESGTDPLPDRAADPVVAIEVSPDGVGTRYRLRLAGASPPNPPIRIARALAIAATLELPAGSAEPLRLLYGDPYLPDRSWSLTPPEPFVRDRIRAALGPEEPNPFSAQPRGLEYLRRRPGLVTLALLGALGLLLLVAWLGRSGTHRPD